MNKKQLTQEEEARLYLDLLRMQNDDNMAGFSRIDFVDYEPAIKRVSKVFPQFVYEITDFGVQIEKRSM